MRAGASASHDNAGRLPRAFGRLVRYLLNVAAHILTNEDKCLRALATFQGEPSANESLAILSLSTWTPRRGPWMRGVMRAALSPPDDMRSGFITRTEPQTAERGHLSREPPLSVGAFWRRRRRHLDPHHHPSAPSKRGLPPSSSHQDFIKKRHPPTPLSPTPSPPARPLRPLPRPPQLSPAPLCSQTK